VQVTSHDGEDRVIYKSIICRSKYDTVRNGFAATVQFAKLLAITALACQDNFIVSLANHRISGVAAFADIRQTGPLKQAWDDRDEVYGSRKLRGEMCRGCCTMGFPYSWPADQIQIHSRIEKVREHEPRASQLQRSQGRTGFDMPESGLRLCHALSSAPRPWPYSLQEKR
jgi:hypothetical protein